MIDCSDSFIYYPSNVGSMTNTTTNATNTTVRASVTLDQARAIVRAYQNRTWDRIEEGNGIDISIHEPNHDGIVAASIDMNGVYIPFNVDSVAILIDGLNFCTNDSYWIIIPISDMRVYEVVTWDPMSECSPMSDMIGTLDDAYKFITTLRTDIHWTIISHVNPSAGIDDERELIDHGIIGN